MKDEGKIGVKVPLTSWQWKIFRDFGEALREHGAESNNGAAQDDNEGEMMEQKFYRFMDKVAAVIMVVSFIYFGGHILVALYRGLLTFP